MLSISRLHIAASALVCSLLVALVVSAAAADAGKRVSRCGFVRAGVERQGIYVVRGHMTCQFVKRYLRRLEQAYQEGTTTKVDNNVSYFDGFYCGGRMGYYW